MKICGFYPEYTLFATKRLLTGHIPLSESLRGHILYYSFVSQFYSCGFVGGFVSRKPVIWIALIVEVAPPVNVWLVDSRAQCYLAQPLEARHCSAGT